MMLTMLIAATLPLATPLETLLDDDWERLLADEPTMASRLGDRRYNDRWPDVSLAALEQRARRNEQSLAKLDALVRAGKIEQREQLDADIYRDILETRLGLYRHKLHLLPLDHMGGVHAQEQLIDALRFTTTQDYEDWLERLERYPALVDQHIALLRAGAAAKMTQPRISLSRVPAQLDKQLVDDATLSSFYIPFKRMPSSLSPAEQQRLSAAGRAAIAKHVVPALRKLRAVVVDEYMPACSDNVAATARAGGSETYAFLVKMHTTTTRTPDEIHALGLREVERIRGEMAKVQQRLGFKGTLPELFKHLRTDARYFYKTGPELLEGTRALAKRVDGKLPIVLKTMPRMPYGVDPVPDAIAPDVTTAYYSRPAADGSRAGTYFVNLYRPEMRPKWEMVPLCLHEAAPGHHTQIALAQELDNVPRLRRYAAPYTAFVEGWGLYAESLGEEMGLYDDPADKMGQLTYEMWRAVRLVVDTGMHAKGWSRERAIAFFLDNAPKTELDVTNEIDRYIVWPGQALAYKSGELKIKELRAKAQRKLGAKFSLGAFHDAVLLAGPVPLSLLEKRIDAWIDAQ